MKTFMVIFLPRLLFMWGFSLLAHSLFLNFNNYLPIAETSHGVMLGSTIIALAWSEISMEEPSK
jgi:hypothetical protein